MEARARELRATNERVRRHRSTGPQRQQTPANWADIFQLPIHLQFRRKTSRWNPAADAKFLRNALGERFARFGPKMSLGRRATAGPLGSLGRLGRRLDRADGKPIFMMSNEATVVAAPYPQTGFIRGDGKPTPVPGAFNRL